MVIRQSSQRFSTRPLVVVMVILAVLALALAAGSVLKGTPAAHVTAPPAAATLATSKSPDAAERNAQILWARYIAKTAKHNVQ